MSDENSTQPPSRGGETALLELAIFAAKQLLAQAPALFAKLLEALNKENVTVEDLEKERNEIASQHYKDFVPATQIPPSEQT